MFIFIPKEFRKMLYEDAKKAGLSKKQFVIDLLFYYYKERIEQQKRTDYYNKINRQ